MTSKNPIDRRPFKSKADHQTQMALEQHYRGVAIPSIVAALTTRKPTPAQEPARD